MKKILLSFAAIMVMAIRADAAADAVPGLAYYDFFGSSRSSADADANSTAGAIVDGAGLATGTAFDISRGNAAPSLSIVSTVTDGTTQATAVSANDYISFTITPNGGFAFNLTSLMFDYANYTNDGTFPTENFFARSSIDSFGANLAGQVTASIASAGAFATETINLTGASFQNVASAIEFRIYFQDGTTDADRGALIDNIILNGTVIPEPSTWAMLGLGAVLLGGVQRFRRK